MRRVGRCDFPLLLLMSKRREEEGKGSMDCYSEGLLLK